MHYTHDVPFEIYRKMKLAKDTWDSLEEIHGNEDLGTNSYVVRRRVKFQMGDTKYIMPQIHEYETVVSEVLAEGMKMCEYVEANIFFEKLPRSRKGYHD